MILEKNTDVQTIPNVENTKESPSTSQKNGFGALATSVLKTPNASVALEKAFDSTDLLNVEKTDYAMTENKEPSLVFSKKVGRENNELCYIVTYCIMTV